MTYAVDLHLHSPFARGTSKRLTFDNLARWAKIKGIDLLATGDFTHPAWLRETHEQLRDAGDGLLERDGVKFILGTEVNCSAPEGGRHRRVHILVFAPTFEAVEAINTALGSKGKLSSDGRPTLRLSARDLVHVLLDIDVRCFVIPAHLWTPWFGLYGSKSGFDSLEECFGDVVGHIYAVETGLSSDPAMNWRVPSLDEVSMVSFSDAHSLPKMGRELTVMRGEPSYDGLRQALVSQDIAYTVEFFPEEGKYHHSGHRKCRVRLSPSPGRRQRRCLLQLWAPHDAGSHAAGRRSGREEGRDGDGCPGTGPAETLVARRSGTSWGWSRSSQRVWAAAPTSKRAREAYCGLISEFGSELATLIDAPPFEVERVAGERVAEGISRVRAGQVFIDPGFDGQYGTVKVWPDS